MILDIKIFLKRVSYYINEEYGKDYYKKSTNSHHTFDIITGYYWGGNNVPDTARAVVEYLKKHENSL